MAKIKKQDIIELDYTGKLKDGTVFDTTLKDVAEKNKIEAESSEFNSITICVGEGQLPKGLEEGLVDKEEGAEYTFELAPENAFGRKNPKLLRMIPMSAFKKQQFNPLPGMQVNIDGTIGTIINVTGGRTIVDFNHPLSSKDVVYTVKVKKILTDTKEKIASVCRMAGILSQDAEIVLEGDKAKITLLKKLHEEEKLSEMLNKQLAEKIKQITGIETEVLNKAEQKKD